MTRSTRILWLCEEMGVPYKTVPVSFRDPDPDFLAVNPLRSLPAMTDGDARMTESIAIMIYVMDKYGPTPLAVPPGDPAHADYLQFLIFGEAGLAMNGNPIIAARFFAPDADKSNWSTRNCAERFLARMNYVEDTLATRPYIAGERFTAADISVGYALGIAEFLGVGDKIPPRVKRYVDGLRERPAFQRAAARA
jgi:glutathione S-transferase